MNPDKVNTCKAYLANNLIFQALNSTELDMLVSYARTKSFKRNEVIFSKGDTGGEIYIILSGAITITTLSEEGKESILAILEQGDVFGEMAMLTNECRTATATMHTSGETLIIERKNFIALLEQSPKTAFKLMQTLCKRLQTTNELLEDNLFQPLPIRLAKKISSLADQYGIEKEDGIFINLKLSQSELGCMVNSARESINKQMRDWKASDTIAFKNGFITIKNSEVLDGIIANYEFD